MAFQDVRRNVPYLDNLALNGAVFLMTIATARAQAVAEILWELKQAEKVATLTDIAERAGFKSGSGGRTMISCLKTVRRDWPHLQWWRAVSDDCVVDSEQKSHLVQCGFAVEAGEGDVLVVKPLADQLMSWNEVESTSDDDEGDAAVGEPV